MTAVITFLSDYGNDDEFVGVCHGVIARIAPEARVLDVTHGIDRHDVRSGALVLRRALPYFPPGVHLAVVDLFAPVAAHLAAGAPLADAGDPIDTDELTPLHTPSARRDDDGGLVAHALAFDRFGNVMLDVEHAELAGSGLKLGHRVTINDELAHYATTFTDVPPGELLLYEDAYRTLALAVNRGSAALHLGLDLDAEVHIRPAAG
jgi:S-adenosylmethionine hydrolase